VFVFIDMVGSFAIFIYSSVSRRIRPPAGPRHGVDGDGLEVDKEGAGEEGVTRGVAGGVALTCGSYGTVGFSAVFAGGLDFAFGTHLGLILDYGAEAGGVIFDKRLIS
jgi:hypothetical protein